MKQQANKVFNTARKDEPAAASEWKAIFDSFGGNIYRFSIEPEEIDAIQPAMDKLKEISTARRRRNGWYVLRFKDLEVEALKYPDECTPWRFSFIVPIFSGRRTQDLTKAFRDEKMNASNLYLPLQWLAPEAVEYTGCPRAEFAGLRIVNLWVDEKVDKSDVKKAADIFRRVYGSTDARTD
jgi:dTDP-4-amino-4,6-dideoxygalactose transaminase